MPPALMYPSGGGGSFSCGAFFLHLPSYPSALLLSSSPEVSATVRARAAGERSSMFWCQMKNEQESEEDREVNWREGRGEASGRIN